MTMEGGGTAVLMMEGMARTPAQYFLSGGESVEKEDVLTNEEFELLDSLAHGQEAEGGDAEEDGAIGQPQQHNAADDAPVKAKRVRRKRAEIQSFLEKHAQRRRVSAEEMRNFLAARKRNRRTPLNQHPPEQPVLTFAAAAAAVVLGENEAESAAGASAHTRSTMATHHRDIKIWQTMCRLLSSYDLDRLQEWIASSFSPHVFLRVVDSEIDTMFGPKAMALFLSAGLGAFPVYNMDQPKIFQLDAAEHASMLDEARRRSPVLASCLTLENTICYKFVSQFDGVRIYYQSIYDIMRNYTMKTPSLFNCGGEAGLPLQGQEVRDLLMANDERGLYFDFTRIKPSDLSDRTDGRTVLEVRNKILADASSGVIWGCVTDVDTLVCPELTSLDLG